MNKYVVITTINEPTEGIRLFLDTDFKVVIVGDEKTPDVYHDLDVAFLDVATQRNMFPDRKSVV